MVFFSQEMLRIIPGNWTFAIVTDREDPDGQIYRNFAMTGAVLETEERVRAQDGEHLKRMLNEEDHRYVFTPIQNSARSMASVIRCFPRESGNPPRQLTELSGLLVRIPSRTEQLCLETIAVAAL
jgi:hypothetical protein